MNDNQQRNRAIVTSTELVEEEKTVSPEIPSIEAGYQPESGEADQGLDKRELSENVVLDPTVMKSLSDSKRKTLLVLSDQPGLSIKDVAETLGVTHTTAGRHLRALCKKGLVVREKEGSMERHYVAQSKEPKPLSWLRVTVQDVKRYIIVEYLVDNCHKENTVNKIANEVNVYHGLLLRTLRQLEKHGFVEMVRPGGWFYVKVQPLLVEHWKKIHEGEWE